jgi:serine/threonine protein kinase
VTLFNFLVFFLRFIFHADYWCNTSDEAMDLIRKMLTVDQSKRWTAAQLLRWELIARHLLPHYYYYFFDNGYYCNLPICYSYQHMLFTNVLLPHSTLTYYHCYCSYHIYYYSYSYSLSTVYLQFRIVWCRYSTFYSELEKISELLLFDSYCWTYCTCRHPWITMMDESLASRDLTGILSDSYTTLSIWFL